MTDDRGRELRSIVSQPKRLALLVALVVGPPGYRRRDSLLALLWPELDEGRARVALNQAVRFLRRELGGAADSVILSRGVDEIGVNADGLWCDATVFRDTMEQNDFDGALRLYRGDLLEGFYAEQGAGFQDWLDRERDLLKSVAARAARAMAGALERDRNYTPAVAAARRAVELAEADERVVRELLQLLDRVGDRAGALQAYATFERRLERDFEAQPAAETTALIERIRARAEPVEHAPEVASPNGVDHVARPVDRIATPGRHVDVVVNRTPDSPKAAARANTPSFLAIVAGRKWWLLAGAMIGAAATLAISSLLR